MAETSWRLFQKDSLRFYRMRPEKHIDLYFTTRSPADGDSDHNLRLDKQADVLGMSSNLVVMNQTHSAKIEQVSEPGEIDADGCFSIESGLALSVRVADCVPVFFWDDDATLTGVVHAGWRGTMAKIALRFTDKVQHQAGIESHSLHYSLGPSIGKCCYNVGEDVFKAFSETWPNSRDFFTRCRKGFFLDLRAANRFLLNAAGAKEGGSLELCTCCERRRFYSYRVEPGRGRNWGVIIRHGSQS
ncbi:peptidoglycan editing factor PgeF [candidate division WOR-3 bacterium]|uniref:Purine nucleoside phosphorylase n=1 Tax=candidate division WOR-3 bacterium TaxID=2052148 RepID=A0A9D5KB81_UNCW3|nr:peptidoglycan editing factor PgeF [candidate division WOR-3 bacterium]MBD3364960.1 peptidoglycan editing factor PgeF [candidate division WOR-3 bacterium]